DELAVALANHAPCDTDRISALRFVAGARVGPGKTDGAEAGEWLGDLLKAVEAAKFTGPSPARRTLIRRVAKSPREIATELSKVYGHELKKVEYIPALALAGRVRLGTHTGEGTHRIDVERIVEPYVKGEQPTTPTSGSGQSGHLIFPVLADVTEGGKRDRYVQLTRVAADQMFDREGRMLPSMPFHSEMSDALFMGGPILAAAGRLTGERKYFDACVVHLKFMQKLVWREDRIYRHSPLDESAWGRGNGFPALGLTLSLSDFPADHPARGELIEMVRAHLRALLKYQDADGSWHQIIDRPESYREFTCTAMITFSLRRGIDRGWLEESEFGPAAARGWEAVKRRIGDEGRLVDVCTGTGKMKSRREYYDREAILGRDPRGGAMALLIATEMLSHGVRN
ncbi:MAG TPA: glycoside hydrolase family 88 protein, partial [Pirellulaceae bacterium]|nr:glycoside hydrolase family 88 protein [Pirellulaceae bacterium]